MQRLPFSSGKLAKSNPDLKVEDLCLTSVEAMTHWVSSASFLHVQIFLKGLLQEWKGLTARLSFVSLVTWSAQIGHILTLGGRFKLWMLIYAIVAAVSQIFKRNLLNFLRSCWFMDEEHMPCVFHLLLQIWIILNAAAVSHNLNLLQLNHWIVWYQATKYDWKFLPNRDQWALITIHRFL